MRLAALAIVKTWFADASSRSASQLERALRDYLPAAGGATTALAYVPLIEAKVRRELAAWTVEQEQQETPAILPKLQPGATPPADPLDPVSVAGRLKGGQPLDASVGARFGGVLGRELSSVRIHDSAAGAAVARDAGARAVAVGEHIAFAPGEYRPGTPVGDALLAHELAHVGQQADAGPGTLARESDSALEQDADTVATGAVVGLWGGLSGGVSRLARLATPRLRSGLRLQSCNGGTTTAPPAPKAVPADPTTHGPDQHAGVKLPDAATQRTILGELNPGAFDTSAPLPVGPVAAPPVKLKWDGQTGEKDWEANRKQLKADLMVAMAKHLKDAMKPIKEEAQGPTAGRRLRGSRPGGEEGRRCRVRSPQGGRGPQRRRPPRRHLHRVRPRAEPVRRQRQGGPRRVGRADRSRRPRRLDRRARPEGLGDRREASLRPRRARKRVARVPEGRDRPAVRRRPQGGSRALRPLGLRARSGGHGRRPHGGDADDAGRRALQGQGQEGRAVSGRARDALERLADAGPRVHPHARPPGLGRSGVGRRRRDERGLLRDVHGGDPRQADRHGGRRRGAARGGRGLQADRSAGQGDPAEDVHLAGHLPGRSRPRGEDPHDRRVQRRPRGVFPGPHRVPRPRARRWARHADGARRPLPHSARRDDAGPARERQRPVRGRHQGGQSGINFAAALPPQLALPGARDHRVISVTDTTKPSPVVETRAQIGDQNGVSEADLVRANPGVADWAKLKDGDFVLVPKH